MLELSRFKEAELGLRVPLQDTALFPAMLSSSGTRASCIASASQLRHFAVSSELPLQSSIASHPTRSDFLQALYLK